jgi:DNA invertase Pin-like site-specific DNA recombinase
VTLGESIDTTTPAGRLQLHILSAISQFERDRIRERVVAVCAAPEPRGSGSADREPAFRSIACRASVGRRWTRRRGHSASRVPP